jgi:hypothetical protein
MIDTMNFFDADGYYNALLKKQKQTRYLEYLDTILCLRFLDKSYSSALNKRYALI